MRGMWISLVLLAAVACSGAVQPSPPPSSTPPPSATSPSLVPIARALIAELSADECTRPCDGTVRIEPGGSVTVTELCHRGEVERLRTIRGTLTPEGVTEVAGLVAILEGGHVSSEYRSHRVDGPPHISIWLGEREGDPATRFQSSTPDLPHAVKDLDRFVTNTRQALTFCRSTALASLSGPCNTHRWNYLLPPGRTDFDPEALRNTRAFLCPGHGGVVGIPDPGHSTSSSLGISVGWHGETLVAHCPGGPPAQW